MDEKTKAEMAYIINTLRGDLDYAKAEISRLDFEDEAAKKDGDTHGPNAAGGIQNLPQPQGRHFGMAMLPIHYTFGRGVPEALGDDTEGVAYDRRRPWAAADLVLPGRAVSPGASHLGRPQLERRDRHDLLSGTIVSKEYC